MPAVSDRNTGICQGALNDWTKALFYIKAINNQHVAKGDSDTCVNTDPNDR
jgi:hypothetical protein